jgi:SsrA-binding protein
MADANKKQNLIAENRRARFDYDIIETIQAGIVLTGTEVKSLRENKASIGESYASVEGGELWLINSHVPEIDKFQRSISREGMTVVPLKLYFEKGRAKLDIAIAKGRKAHDKRAAVKERDWNRDKARLI